MNNLLKDKPQIINIGIADFYRDLKLNQASALHVEWRPPLVNDPKMQKKLFLNIDKIKAANKVAIAKILAAKPTLIGMDLALNVIPKMEKNLILHAGPPVSWERMCGPMKGAVLGALIYEEMANNIEEAEKLVISGKIKFAPCHEHCCVGPMAGIISPSMPVFIIENLENKNKSYTTMNEGLGKVLRYGAYDTSVIERLRWMNNVLYPVLKDAIQASGGIDLKSIIAQALHMGDEVHNRNRAGTSLFYRQITPFILKTCKSNQNAIDVLNFINSNDHFFLNLSMAQAKASLDAGKGVKYSSLLTVMARNGTDFGIQLSGAGNTWFVGKALVPDALYFPGFTKADANPDIGDSAITETAGLGGFAMAASPAIVQFVGGKSEDATNFTLKMYEITESENNIYQIPYLNFRGTPTGIDVLKVVEKNILPVINTGVAHKNPGIGQVGAGVLSAPIEPFIKAYQEFIKSL